MTAILRTFYWGITPSASHSQPSFFFWLNDATYAEGYTHTTPLSLSVGLDNSSIFVFGLVTYAVFRDANNQKDLLVQPCESRCSVWGRPAGSILAKHQTADGKKHISLLICSDCARTFLFKGS